MHTNRGQLAVQQSCRHDLHDQCRTTLPVQASLGLCLPGARLTIARLRSCECSRRVAALQAQQLLLRRVCPRAGITPHVDAALCEGRLHAACHSAGVKKLADNHRAAKCHSVQRLAYSCRCLRCRVTQSSRVSYVHTAAQRCELPARADHLLS